MQFMFYIRMQKNLALNNSYFTELWYPAIYVHSRQKYLEAVISNDLQKTEGIRGCAHLKVQLPCKLSLLVHYV